LAVATGIGMMLLSYAIMMRPQGQSIAGFFLERAYAEGGGRNVVNVILVDFRGFDTLGEITVLAIVALTVFALLRRFRPAPDSVSPPEQQRIQRELDDALPDREDGATLSDYLFVASVIMQWLFPVIMVLAAYLFLRGHDLPGGGFAAGIAMTAAFILQYMAAGTRWLEDRLRILPLLWMGVGLLVAVAAGAGSWLFGYPFLTSHARYLDLPLIGEVPMASAILFDLGVFSLVVGATVLMLIAIAHQSIRSLRTTRTATKSEAA
jgi:multicomponent K+:H+ antiporter subunit A